EAIVQRALEKVPEARFASASEFAAALEALPALPEALDAELAEAAQPGGEALEATVAATRAMAELASLVGAPAGRGRARSPRRWAWLTVPVAACVWLGWTVGSSPHGSASNKPA